MKSLKNVVVLTLITVIFGFLLGFVHDITKEPIEEANLKAKQEAFKSVFPMAESFGEISDETSEPIGTTSNPNVTIDEVLSALDKDGKVIGYVFTITTKEGYGGDIKLSMGVSSDGTLNGIEFLSISETAGLGMNADTDEFKSQFTNMHVSQISYTKTGRQKDYEIDAISGATITTNAVTNAVNAGLSYFADISGGGDNE